VRRDSHRTAPLPDDLARRSTDIKGSIYFLNTAHVGIFRMVSTAWLDGREKVQESYAIIMVVEVPRKINEGNRNHD
jgi:hypothetical protein